MPKLNDMLTRFGAQLPDDILVDLRDAFEFYDKKKEGFIGMQHFQNILHNFGFADMTKKETEQELGKLGVDLQGKSGIGFPELQCVIG